MPKSARSSWTSPPVNPMLDPERPASSGRVAPRLTAYRIALGLALAYLGALIALELGKVGDLRNLFALGRQFPGDEGYTLCFWAYILAQPAMTVAAALPVVAALLGLGGRSPRGALVAYACVQVLLIAAQWASALYIVRYGPFTYFAGGFPRTFRVFDTILRPLPMADAMFSVPLLLMPVLLVPAVRRAFRARNP